MKYIYVLSIFMLSSSLMSMEIKFDDDEIFELDRLPTLVINEIYNSLDRDDSKSLALCSKRYIKIFRINESNKNIKCINELYKKFKKMCSFEKEMSKDLYRITKFFDQPNRKNININGDNFIKFCTLAFASRLYYEREIAVKSLCNLKALSLSENLQVQRYKKRQCAKWKRCTQLHVVQQHKKLKLSLDKTDLGELRGNANFDDEDNTDANAFDKDKDFN